MKFKYIYQTFWNLVLIIILFAALNNNYSYGQETAIIALLILIYASISWIGISLEKQGLHSSIAIGQELQSIRKLVSKESLDFDEGEQEKELKRVLSEYNVTYWINAISCSILWIMAILGVITA